MVRYWSFFCLLILFASCGAELGEGVNTTDGVGESEHRVFVTSSTMNGNLGGLTGADTVCTNSAAFAGLSRVYKAVISTTAENARDRLTFSGTIYKVSSGEKIPIASSGSDLWNTDNANLIGRIDSDEYGNSTSGVTNVWTGTTSDGSVQTTSNCDNWSSQSNSGTYGSVDQFDDRWINESFTSCNQQFRLFCVSQ